MNAGVFSEHGLFVCFEGGEGSGKSTQSRLLRDALVAEGYAVRLTFEPGDTAVGKEVRRIVLSPETGELSHRTEALLYAAARAELVEDPGATADDYLSRIDRSRPRASARRAGLRLSEDRVPTREELVDVARREHLCTIQLAVADADAADAADASAAA